MSPVPHGLPKSNVLTEEDCNALGIHCLFSKLSVDDWADVNKVADELFKVPTLKVQDSKLTRKTAALALIPAAASSQQQANKQQGSSSSKQKQPEASQQAAASSRVAAKQESSQYHGMKEADGVKFQDSTIGTIIKHKALEIYSRWKDGKPISDQEYHWMACGLSSTWDLTSKNLAMVHLGCSREILEQVSKPLIDKQHRASYKLPTLVDQTFDIIVALIAKEHSSRKAKVYIQQVQTRSPEVEKLLEALVTVIETIDSNTFLLNPDNKSRVTEYDFIMQVWAPLLKSLVDIHGVLRMKTGESSPPQGIAGRKRSYSETRVGFKVDVRLLYDSRDNEHDLFALEAAKAGSDPKLCHDA